MSLLLTFDIFHERHGSVFFLGKVRHIVPHCSTQYETYEYVFTLLAKVTTKMLAGKFYGRRMPDMVPW